MRLQKSHVMLSSAYASLHLVTMVEHAYQMGEAILVSAHLNGQAKDVGQVGLHGSKTLVSENQFLHDKRPNE